MSLFRPPSRAAMLLRAPLAAILVSGGATPAIAGSAGQSTAQPTAQSTDVPPLPAGAHAPPGTGGIMAAPGDAEAAIRAEFAAMEQRGTADAYRLFAARHPGHPLARTAVLRADALADQ
ncbi:hypothetical protein Q4610_03570 [Sphingobium sp. HBC34]|uniref:DUF4168 domain-containing protein n=1 Tax=Sphingobium cyanobacteriorum TaxID=3063954 RepID=A0ABT8ZKQ0_9SPHN|nr:hypothetical protein [Sphingobium sp. HBC34]MDO7834116.1 hypothetical protein [Sphingobium sp. HBC34]